ncbi:MAG: BamA/TamA family outer membrane protein, partial [Chitinophagaceae bacterium]|nr:BamA/TamA family outer membrane protein [Chitinophagaceae bacterium]
IPKLQSEGYLAASIDSIGISTDQYDVYYFKGTKYNWAEVNCSQIPKGILLQSGINPLLFTNKAVNPAALAAMSQKILNACEQSGHPFAIIWLSNVIIVANDKISATLNIDMAEKRSIDSIIIQGEVKITNAFIHRYLDIKKGEDYDEKKMKNISGRLKDLPFLQESMPWQIQFRPKDTRLNLFLKEKKANQLNAILGLMPNNIEAQKLLLTADVQFALQNFLGYGESISASYQNLQVKSPRIKADFELPYIAKSPIGTDAHFDFFTSNLQFRKISFQSGLRYQLSTKDLLKVYYQSTSNRIIEIDSAAIINTRQLPANIDAKASGIGVALESRHLDSRSNPRKGFDVQINVTALQRKIIENNAITGLKDVTGFNFSSLYDSMRTKNNQYQLVAKVSQYIPIGKNFCLKIGYLGGYVAGARIFRNELFIIGGFKLLRGFDEQSIFANQYHISVTELRLRMGGNSYAYLFSDNGWVQSQYQNFERSGFYNGFGVGTSLETKSGIFSIALAFGRSDFQALRFRESKITFGYLSLF